MPVVLKQNTSSKSVEATRTLENETIDTQKNVDLNKSSFDLTKTELTNVSQNRIATCNTEPSFSIDNPSESLHFKNIKITPSTSSSFNRSHSKLMQIEHRSVFQPPKKRSKPLNLSASKKQRTKSKEDNMKEIAKEDKLSNNMVKKGRERI